MAVLQALCLISYLNGSRITTLWSAGVLILQHELAASIHKEGCIIIRHVDTLWRIVDMRPLVLVGLQKPVVERPSEII